MVLVLEVMVIKAANDDANSDDSGVGNTTIQRKGGAHKQ